MAQQAPAEEHQAGQDALVSLIPAVLRQAWPLLDVHNIKATLPQFVAAVRAIVQQFGQASATAALQHYQQQRVAAVAGPMPEVKLAPSPADKVIEDAVGWATADLYDAVTPETEQAALDRVSESVSRLVLDQGRDTIIGAVAADPKAKGWVRVTEAKACAFCTMLALRGATYKSERSADFKAHDNCRCHVEPIFTAYEPSARMREMERVWRESTNGRSGKDAQVAFRQALEGRPVTGKSGKPSKPVKATGTDGLSHLSADQIRHQIALTEGLKDSAWRTSQLARLRKALRTAK